MGVPLFDSAGTRIDDPFTHSQPFCTASFRKRQTLPPPPCVSAKFQWSFVELWASCCTAPPFTDTFTDSGQSGAHKPLPHMRLRMEPVAGLEPATDGLQNRCSTTELNWREKQINPFPRSFKRDWKYTPKSKVNRLCSFASHRGARKNLKDCPPILRW